MSSCSSAISCGSATHGCKRGHQAGELVNEQLGPVSRRMRVDEARHDVALGGVQHVATLVGADAGDDAVHNGDIDFEPLLREDRQDATSADDEVGAGSSLPRATAEAALQPFHRPERAAAQRPSHGRRSGGTGGADAKEARLDQPLQALARRAAALGVPYVPVEAHDMGFTPRSLDQALRLKAEHVARPRNGRHGRAQLRLDATRRRVRTSTRSPSFAAGRRRRTLRLGAGLTYAEAMSGEVAEALPALAEARRSVRNRGTIGGTLAPPAAEMRCRRCSSRAQRSRS